MSSKPTFNVQFKVIPETLEKPFQDLFPSYPNGLVRGEPGGYVMPASFTTEVAKEIWEMQARKDDVWIVTFLKSGTTWMSELVWLLKNNLNYEEAAKRQIVDRTPYPEMRHWMSQDLLKQLETMNLPFFRTPKEIDQLPSPRVLRPHLTIDLLNPNLLESTKVIYVARNPKDTIVSYYHFHRTMKNQTFTGTFDQFVEYFMDDKILATPYFTHVLSAWKRRNHPNMRFVFYEEMKKDLPAVIRNISSFLDVKITEAEVEKLASHLDFSNIEKNETVNQNIAKQLGVATEGAKFMRKGIIGDWKNHFSPELNARVDKWIADNIAGTDLKFVLE